MRSGILNLLRGGVSLDRCGVLVIRRFALEDFRRQLNNRHMLDDLLCLVHRDVDDLLDGLDLWNLNNLFDVLDLRNVDLYDLLLDLWYVHVPDLLDDLHWPWHMNVPVHDLHLGHLDNLFHVLNLRNMNLNNLFLCDEFRDVPDLLDGLHWSGNVHMPLDHLHLWNLHNPLHMLNLGNWNVNDFLLMHDLGNMANLLLLLLLRIGRDILDWCTISHLRSAVGWLRSAVGWLGSAVGWLRSAVGWLVECAGHCAAWTWVEDAIGQCKTSRDRIAT